MLTTIVAISGVILSILLLQYVRVQKHKRKVKQAREREAAIKEFKELCGFSPYEVDEHERVKRVRHILHALAKEYMHACFNHDTQLASQVRRRRQRVHTLADYFGIDAHHSKPQPRNANCRDNNDARTVRFA